MRMICVCCCFCISLWMVSMSLPWDDGAIWGDLARAALAVGVGILMQRPCDG